MVSKRFVFVNFLLIFNNLFEPTGTQNNTFPDITNIINSLYLQNLENIGEIYEIFSNVSNQISKIPKTKCSQEISLALNNTIKGEKWALEMIDAIAKPQSGILYGNIAHLGNYDECLQIHGIVNDSSIAGKYCLAEMQIDSPQFQFQGTDVQLQQQFLIRLLRSYAFCFPKSCSVKEIQEIFDLMLDKQKSLVRFEFSDVNCDDGEPRELSAAAVVACAIFGFFALIITASTIYDLHIHKTQNGKGVELFKAFSFYSNGSNLFSLKTNDGSLKCLNGLRVISMMWIIVGHRFLYSMFLPTTNAVEILSWQNRTEASLLTSVDMAVDTFFVISGLLVSYLFLKGVKKGVKMSIPMLYFHRILRLTPSLLMVMLLSGTLTVYTGRGPVWNIIYETYQKPCETNWWSTLIYLQNYIHPHEQCVGQAWYLAVDTQMYFLSPLFLLSLLKWPKKTICGAVILIILSSAYVFEVTWKKHLGTVVFQQTGDTFKYIYIPTHVRGAAYLIGLISGYYIHKTSTKKVTLCKLSVLLFWCFSLLILVGVVLAHAYFAQNEYDVVKSSVCNALFRVAWSLAISLLIFLCTNDYGGPINAFLSLPVFTVMIRLNYSMYLLHSLVITMMMAQLRTSVYFTDLVGFHAFWGDFMFTLGASIVWTLAFESPIRNLEKIIFNTRPKTCTVLVRKTRLECDVEDGNGIHVSNGKNK